LEKKDEKQHLLSIYLTIRPSQGVKTGFIRTQFFEEEGHTGVDSRKKKIPWDSKNRNEKKNNFSV